MCGIAGIVSCTEQGRQRTVAVAMQSRMQHRGPDDQGSFEDPSGGAVLTQTRLAILDLSAAGHQPMHSRDERFVIVFNGEIYNYKELRQQLRNEGIQFRTDSDTEVLLALYEREGQACVTRLQGMFAFAVWDTIGKSLFLARDPLGIKPLYVWQTSDALAFASELRATLEADLGPRRLNPAALADYLTLGSVQEPDTLVAGISVLPAGHTLVWNNGTATQSSFWQLSFAHSGGAEAISDLNTAVQLTRHGLEGTLHRHFVSDVPVGIFLSGGIDSTAVVALARSTGYDQLKTFCISFEQPEFNEGDLAARTASRFGTEHTDWRMTPNDGRKLVEQYLEAMDQPSNDGFNTFCVSKLAHDRGMKVVLSGLGGDELFAGYPSFQKIPRLVQVYRRLSFFHSRSAAALLLKRISSDARLQRVADYLASDGGVPHAWRAMRGFFTDREVQALLSWISGTSVAAEFDGCRNRWADVFTGTQTDSIADQISRCELTGYMRNQLLRDSDVMSMAWGLELRVPFVDRGLVEEVSRIDSSIRLRRGKQLLREAVPELPEWILNQPKRGFRFPFENWARDCWSTLVDELEPRLPVRCGAWHRFWSLFVLRHFLVANRIEGASALTNGDTAALASR